MIFALINQKGGVGKTTNTIHIGAALALQGHKTLLIDMDSQCDLSHGCGIRKEAYSIKNFLDGSPNFKLQMKADNFYILPGDKDFEPALYSRKTLKNLMPKLKEHFDYILLDCPPQRVNEHYVTAQELALISCDFYLIPLEASETTVKNANAFLGRVHDYIVKYNPSLRFLGFFFSNVLVTRKSHNHYGSIIKEVAKDLLFRSFVRSDAQVESAVAKGKTIFQLNPNCRASWDYQNLTTELLKQINND